MAEHLASIFGTEKDRVNCPFYFKIGACRHGDRCSRLHNKPSASQTVLLTNMYRAEGASGTVDPRGAASGKSASASAGQGHFEAFVEDLFEELDECGEIEGVNVCDNATDHMAGNVYVKFVDEDGARRASEKLQGRYYDGRPILVEYSPVTDFKESTCRQYEENSCTRGGYCNFMHLRPIGRSMRKQLYGRYLERRRRDDDERRDRRSRSPPRKRSRDDEDDGRVNAKGMSDDARRAMFAQWNEEGAD
jgi:splicing factor U2AF 35 kDa subunit